MIYHYLKISFRNLIKYKIQSIISIIGLAVGFTCFALASLWIHYEMTYDSYHQGADRTYLFYTESNLNQSGYSTYTSYQLSKTLRHEFPEVEATCSVQRREIELKVEGKNAIKVYCVSADSTFLNMFPVTSVESGSLNFIHSDSQIALTEEVAIQLFGSVEVIGKSVEYRNTILTVGAIFSNVDKHSNLYFGCWMNNERFWQTTQEWGYQSFQSYIRLRKDIDPESFQKKLHSFQLPADKQQGISLNKFMIIPITHYQYSIINNNATIRFSYLVLFSVTSSMIILCALFNYLSLYNTRIHRRGREIELRKACGSSNRGLFLLFGIEYMLILLVSGLVGMTLIELSLPIFRQLSNVNGNLYGESVLYFGGIFILAYLMFIPFTIRRCNKKVVKHNLFRKCNILFQLIISLLLIFCVSILMKQLYQLTHGDIGWERKNTAVLSQYIPLETYEHISATIDQFPYVLETLKGRTALFPISGESVYVSNSWDGKEGDKEQIEIISLFEGEPFFRFYNLKLLKGEMLKPDDTDNIIINETCVKALGINDPIGKKVYFSKPLTIIGVVKDFHVTAPTIPVKPTMLCGEHGMGNYRENSQDILIKYQEGKWDTLKNQIDSLYKQSKADDTGFHSLINVEEVYEKFLKSENLFLKLLSFASIVCILIAVFGIFSFITLSCEERRKEIAVRKVNGATIKDILVMFVREYTLLLIFAAVIAFPIGYALMKQWLQSYVEQTEISFWIYIAIFAGVVFIIAGCIGWRVWQAARQNPAEVIKSE